MISEMARRERIVRGYHGALLWLTLLAPNLVGLILDGRASRACCGPLVIPNDGVCLLSPSVLLPH